MLNFLRDNICEGTNGLLEICHLGGHTLNSFDVDIFLGKEGLYISLLVRFELMDLTLDLIQLFPQIQGAVTLNDRWTLK